MSELETIQTALERASRRRRWQRAWGGLWRGLLVGAGLWLLALVIYKLAPIPERVLIIAGGLAGVALLAGFFYGWFHKQTLQQTARWVDSHQRLQERLSTALEMARAGGNESWRQLLISDAAKFAAKIDIRKLMPLGLPRASRWALLILAVSVGLGFVPEYRSKEFKDNKLDAAIIKESGKKLVELTKQNLERRPTVMEPTRKAMEAVETTGLQMAKTTMTRNDALKDLAKVTDQLKSELKQMNNPAIKSMERSSREASRGNGMTPNADLQNKIDALQKSLGKATDPNDLAKMKNQLKDLKKAASGIPANDNSSQAKDARQQLADAMANLQREAQDKGLNMPDLDAAMAALKANQTDDLIRDLDAATSDIEKMKEMAQNLEQLQQQAKDGKDLPEQLKFGQPQLAQQSLKKMIEQLKSPNLTQEQMNKILEEVSKSVDPASPYAKAAEHLKASAASMQKNDKGEASKSLAKASEELQKAVDQMQDAQALMASLDALNKAELAIATRCNWGQKPGNGLGPPHAGPGGMPGRGVGTWADENSTFYPEITERWSNEGIERPDTDGKGLTDRGDPKLADNLAPTKLKGQITPGGSMPSITLKGVSIKGQSSVSYQEEATAAQTAAQSALNQDQVPRAYQGAVRDYFDDLKK